MPRSQIRTARLDEAAGIINVAGPFADDGITLGTLLIHVTLIQGSAHAHGVGSETQVAPSPGIDREWSAPAETSGQFHAGQPVEAFGIVIMVVPDTDPNPAPGIARLHYETFTWSERVKLEKQL